MKRIKLFAILLIISLNNLVHAQHLLKGQMYNDLEVTNSITKSFGDSVYYFQVKALDESSTLSVADKRFYWFHQGEVKSTIGSSSGKVLHGKFEKFDRNGNLKEKGVFRNGTKEGLWLQWYTNGNIASKYEWNDGFREGHFDEYQETGVLTRSGSFRHNLLHGQLQIYNIDGTLNRTETFKKGINKTKKAKPEKPKKERKVKEEKIKEGNESKKKTEQTLTPNETTEKKSKVKKQKTNKSAPALTSSPKPAKKKFTLFKKAPQPVIDPAYEKKN